MSVQKKLYTFAEFETFTALSENETRRFELFNGEIIEVSPSRPHGKITSLFVGEMYVAIKQHSIVGELHVEVKHKLPGDNHTAMIPDVSFIKDTADLPTDSSPIPRMPDLAIEIKSPTNSYQQQRDKAAYYIANGSKRVWLVFAERRQVEVYRPGEDVIVLTDKDILDGGAVLPGFALAVKTIFS
jgi:Uma2 family endonuclease